MKFADSLREQEGLSAARDGATFFGRRGEYSFLLLTEKNELVVSVVRGGAFPAKDDLDAFVRGRSELSGCKTDGTRIAFSLRPGATGKRYAEKIHELLPDLFLYLHENGYENCCEVSHVVGETVGAMVNGKGQLFAPALFDEVSRKLAQNEKMQQEIPENIGGGILGAVIGGLIGAAVIVLLGQLGYVAAISGVVLGYCTIGGYRRGAGRLSAAGIAVCVAVMLAAVYLGNRVDIAVTAAKEPGITFWQGFRWMHELVDTDAYVGNLAILYLFTALGAVPEALSAHKALRGRSGIYRIGE